MEHAGIRSFVRDIRTQPEQAIFVAADALRPPASRDFETLADLLGFLLCRGLRRLGRLG